MRRMILWFVWIFVFNNFLKAQSETGMAFLKLPVEARSAAMGEAGTAFARDASAAYWNPALLAVNEFRSLVLMHNAYLADIAQEFVAFQFINGQQNMALSLNLMTIPGIEIRGDRPTEQPAGKTDAINLAAGFSYARSIKNNWKIGFNLKYLYEKYYLEDAGGWAIDIGFFKNRFLSKSIDLGLSLQNIGKMKQLSVESTKLPLLLRGGVVYHTPVSLATKNILAAFDALYLFSEQKVKLSSGLEFPVLKALAIRSGLHFDGEKVRYSAGFGLNYKNYQFHYAFSPYPYNLGNSHRFSLHWQF